MKTISLAAALFATSAFAAAPSTTTIAQSGTAGDYSLTATVTAVGATAPSGAISFRDTDNGGALLASANLVPSVTTLGPPVAQTTAVASAQALAAGDFNGDGILDLAAANFLANSVTILLGKGDGTFTAGAVLPTAGAPSLLVAGRFGARGFLDLAVANGSAVTIFSGNGDGTFTAGATLALPGPANGLVVGSFGGTSSDLAATSAGQISVLRGNGNGTFQPAVSTQLGGNPGALVATSFGAAVIDSASGTLTALLNAGGGTFTVKRSIAVVGSPSGIAAGDFDGDGVADLAVVAGGAVSVFIGDGTGAFAAGSTTTVGAQPAGIVSADFNNDGIADLAVGSAGAAVQILLGRGDGGFAVTSLAGGTAPGFLVAGDFDREGHVDLAVADSPSSNTVTVLLMQTQRTAIASAKGIAPVGLGIHQIVANYPGDGAYAASVSASTGLTTTPTITFTPSQPSLTVTTLGTTVADPIVLNSAGNFSGSVALACSVTFTGTGSAPVPPSCLIDKTLNVTPSVPATATLDIISVAPSALPAQDPRAALGVLLFLGLAPRLRRKKWLLLALAVMATSSACGDNSTNIGTLGTTAGTYRVDITASGSGFTATTSIAVTVTETGQ